MTKTVCAESADEELRSNADGNAMQRADSSMQKKDGDKPANYLTMIGHLCCDVNQGALAAILPFLVAGGGYSYTHVALMLCIANISSAVIQPLFGWIGDRKSCPWFMALGVFLAGLGMACMGYVESFGAVLLCALITGSGTAMFHPEGGRLANLAAGSRKGNGMSIFAVGGNVGFFLGPLLVTFFLSLFGLHGTIAFIVPVIVCSSVLLFFNGRFKALGIAQVSVSSSGEGDAPREHWGMFWLTMGVLSVRSILSYGFISFIPLFLMGVFGQSEGTSSLVISLFAIVGAIATLLSGRVGEYLGSGRLAIACLAASTVSALAFTFNESLPLAIIISVIMSVGVDLFYPSVVAQGMGYVPRHLGTASGLTYGVAICIGGAFEPVLGLMGDAYGLTTVMLILAALGVLGVVLAVILRRKHVALREWQV